MSLSLRRIRYGYTDVKGGLALHLRVGRMELAAGLVLPKLHRLFFINRWRENSRQITIGPLIVGYYIYA